MKKRKHLILTAIGLLLLVFTWLVAQFIFIPDSLKGVLMGIGIGIEVLALIKCNGAKKRQLKMRADNTVNSTMF
ncbi:hypothetical protein [Arachidicoccus sp.]|jgi:hypothetical protein|uniref:hypothetical protein n=1 Tax=Arachidicoccus sp. TaxID=1872624 RepID=UPI003D1F41B0